MPGGGYDLRLVTPVPLPRKLNGDLFRLPWRIRRSIAGRPGRARRRRRRRGGGLRRVRRRARHPALPLPGRLGPARRHRGYLWWSTRPTPAPDWPTGSRTGRPPGTRRGSRLRARRSRGGQDAAACIDHRAGPRGSAGRQGAHFGFADDARVLLVFGGSQGAVSINAAVSAAAGDLAAAGCRSLPPTAERTPWTCRPRPGDPPYVACPYLKPDGPGYRRRRPGDLPLRAMTVAGVGRRTAGGVRAAADRQRQARLNALPVVQAGGGVLIADAELTRVSARRGWCRCSPTAHD